MLRALSCHYDMSEIVKELGGMLFHHTFAMTTLQTSSVTVGSVMAAGSISRWPIGRSSVEVKGRVFGLHQSTFLGRPFGRSVGRWNHLRHLVLTKAFLSFIQGHQYRNGRLTDRHVDVSHREKSSSIPVASASCSRRHN